MILLSIISGMVFTVCVGIGDFIQSMLARDIGRYKTLLLRHFLTIIIIIPFFFYFYNQGAISFDLIAIIWLFTGTFFYLAGYVNFLKAFEIGNVSVISPISSAGAAITIILSAIFLNEKLKAIAYFAIVSIMLGIGLTSTDIKKLQGLKEVKGLRESFITLISFGIYFFTIGYAGKRIDTLNLFMFAMGFQSIIFIIYNYLKCRKTLKRNLFAGRLLKFLVITFLYIFAWIGFNYGAAKGLISIVSPVSALYPLITVILATIFYKERLVLNQKIGIVVTLLGLLLLNL